MNFEFDLGIAVLSEFDEDGYLGAQPDVLGEGDSGVQAYELHHPFGFMSRPDDPDVDGNGTPTKGAALLYWMEGSQGHALGLQDPRIQSKLPQLKKGGSIQYDKVGAFDVFSPDAGNTTRTTYVPYSFSNGVPQKAHSITIDGASGNESISIVHGEGHSILLNAQGSAIIKNKAGDAYVEVNAGGITLNGNAKVNGGITLGDPVGAEPVMLSVGLLAWIAQVNVAFAAIAAASGLNSNPTVVAPVAIPLAATKTSAK